MRATLTLPEVRSEIGEQSATLIRAGFLLASRLLGRSGGGPSGGATIGGLSPEDFVNEALCRMLEGRRKVHVRRGLSRSDLVKRSALGAVRGLVHEARKRAARRIDAGSIDISQLPDEPEAADLEVELLEGLFPTDPLLAAITQGLCAGLTHEEIAQRVGVSVRRVQRAIYGKIRRRVLAVLSRRLGWSATDPGLASPGVLQPRPRRSAADAQRSSGPGGLRVRPLPLRQSSRAKPSP